MVLHCGNDFSYGHNEDIDAPSCCDGSESVSNENRCTISTMDQRFMFHFRALKKTLKRVVARRAIAGEESKTIPRAMELGIHTSASNLHDVVEVIQLRPFDPVISHLRRTARVTYLGKVVEEQIALYIKEVAELYNIDKDTTFHSFDHATNVMAAVMRLFEPINRRGHEETSEQMHVRTFGIPFDPIVQFTCLLAALVHDADHPGVPNKQFEEERPDLATKYGRQSVAEKLSFDHAWNLLMQDRFYALRSSIYGSVEEFQRFRALFVNAVMGTDAFDTKLVKRRKDRWTRAFRIENITCPQRSLDRKATIAVHYLLLAADVSHTMSTWDVYCSWNRKLFFEMTSAWEYGRNDKRPANSWYEGELSFYDGWIIPLAEKLNGLGLFGSLGDSNLVGAIENRRRWELEGQDVVTRMTEAAESM